MIPAEYLYAARRAFSGKESERGQALCETLLKEFPDSPEAKDADELLRLSDPERAKPEAQSSTELPRTTDVRVVDFDMPFMSMVRIYIKATFAGIPAAIIVLILVYTGLALIRALA